ncbi:MAG TPA: LuxR C-terminal-related transcriptional regulator [Gammaproteobacteria bacterium]|nr:LuxR C-terminal-related transcriptional regulator [Gammaproteobacteria bacterium]
MQAKKISDYYALSQLIRPTSNPYLTHEVFYPEFFKKTEQTKKLTTTSKINIAEKKRYYLGNKYPGVYFTNQEAKCMVHFLKGLSNAKIGKILQLSTKTIGYYCSRMRFKLGCRTKLMLIELIKTTDFMHCLHEID